MHIEAETVRGIPVLTIAPPRAQGCPAVLFIPGYGGRKEDGLALGYQLAEAGLFAICVDPWLHGARFDPRRDSAADPAHGGVYPPETGLDTGIVFFQVIRQCLSDAETLIEHYAADPRVDTRRCGVTGLSMGGYASYLIFARLTAVAAAVPMIGIPAFGARWRDLVDECAFSNPEWAGALDAAAAHVSAHAAFIGEIDPLEGLKRAAPRALLMMNCDFDADQPKLYAITAYRELRDAYAGCPEQLRLRIYPAGHAVTPQMERDAVAWFREHLATGTSDGAHDA